MLFINKSKLYINICVENYEHWKCVFSIFFSAISGCVFYGRFVSVRGLCHFSVVEFKLHL